MFLQNTESESNSHNSQQLENLSAKLSQAQIEVKHEKAALAQLTEKMKKYEMEHASTPANLQPFDQMQSLKNELEELKWQKEQMKRYEAAHASRLRTR